MLRRVRRSLFRPSLVLSVGAMLAACGTSGPAEPSSFVAAFDSVWQRYDRIYPYFDYKQIDWAAARAEFRPRAEAATSADALALVVRDMLSGLKDVHASMTNPSGVNIPTWQPTRFVNWQRTGWQKRMAAAGIVSRPGGWGHGVIDGVPYLYFDSWQSALDLSAVDAALDSYAGQGVVIIDVRMNGGGNDTPAFAVAGRFQSTARAIGTVQYRSGPSHSDFGSPIVRTVKPRGQLLPVDVIVLAGRGSFSSAEGFLMAMKGAARVTIAGDTSGGGSGNPESDELLGGWRYNLPRWIERTVTGDVVEWRGIAPDVAIAADAASFASVDDPVLDAAIKLARSRIPQGARLSTSQDTSS